MLDKPVSQKLPVVKDYGMYVMNGKSCLSLPAVKVVWLSMLSCQPPPVVDAPVAS
jgi:hypothetical protein